MIQACLQVLKLAFFDDKVVLIIQVFHNVVMAFLVVFQDHGFDRGIALDKKTWILWSELKSS